MKARQVKNYRFLRQKVINSYIVDFYCSKLKLVIEIDGQYHQDRSLEDRNRLKSLEQAGLTIVRFTNAEVKCNMDKVLQVIIEKIEALEMKKKRKKAENQSNAE